MKRVLFLLILSILIIPHFILAQSVGDTGNVVMSAQPETPGPNAGVTLTLDSSRANLDASTITWAVNGKTIVSKKGQKTFTTQTGNAGSAIVVSASVDTGSDTYVASLSLAPSSVDLLTQGRGYVPPFYQGGSIWTTEGTLTILAIPHVVQKGKELSPSSFIYKWTKDGTVLGGSSGAGQNSITFGSSILSLPTQVSVDVMTNDGTVVASNSLSLAPQAPSLLVYESSPLYGVLFNSELGTTVTLNEQEASLRAFPLFFSIPPGQTSDPRYTWSVGGADANNSTDTITLRAPDTVSNASSQVSVSINGVRNVTQAASRDLLVQYKSQ